MEQKLKQNWKLFLIASLTLGLAPFKPPHIVGKLKWIAGGNAFSGEHAMQFKDWFDVLLHGSPWVLLLVSVILNLSSLAVKTDSE
ncbi:MULTISPECIES: hypothetical protein [unclassified Tenacibaculum]|uniref:hypothetical protein n=1 Tax=unclassified Tenacibaculum TaxID=2635139 RepID=UPI001F4558B1|nr:MULTISPECIES: hypothetical protein [unclassified Tenacibaculum]MCF2875467.1 hypothetical protein [Tenacibaculum sp. Cn5-1]MCF2935543.1 hypothetical protein [Tenacibaculum sp. Cn5-34]MCG7512103.1 hypothetical protein [Tenacibaculum sp. Cn5-46]